MYLFSALKLSLLADGLSSSLLKGLDIVVLVVTVGMILSVDSATTSAIPVTPGLLFVSSSPLTLTTG